MTYYKLAVNVYFICNNSNSIYRDIKIIEGNYEVTMRINFGRLMVPTHIL